MSEFYHTYNRAVEKRKIFLETADYRRAVHDLYEFNDVNATLNFKRRLDRHPTSIGFDKEKEGKLVNLLVWCLMPNHYHLFLSPIVNNGLSKFHQKFSGGLTKFFNIKYDRSGVLFQGKYKKVRVLNDNQALQLICYIHSNPLDIWKPDWKEKGLTDSEIQEALNFLEREYRWSSHLDYLGVKNYPSLIDNNFISNFFNGPEQYREIFTNWLRYYTKNIHSIEKFILEQ
jgi:putative transposase